MLSAWDYDWKTVLLFSFWQIGRSQHLSTCSYLWLFSWTLIWKIISFPLTLITRFGFSSKALGLTLTALWNHGVIKSLVCTSDEKNSSWIKQPLSRVVSWIEGRSWLTTLKQCRFDQAKGSCKGLHAISVEYGVIYPDIVIENVCKSWAFYHPGEAAKKHPNLSDEEGPCFGGSWRILITHTLIIVDH